MLFMGRSNGTKEGILYAKEMGIYTIMTDYYSPEDNPLKKLTDEYWMINVSDIEELEKKCRSERITGIFAATNEFCLDQTKILCRKLDLPFYASDEGWASARDKLRFKKHCRDCGLSVPRNYSPERLLRGDMSEKPTYPLIVKPVDSCAQQGLSLCWNEKELRDGYDRAVLESPQKKVLIEEYILGDELDAFYFIQDGRPVLTGLSDKYFMKINDRRNASFQPGPSRFFDEYTEKLSEKVKHLFQSMNCTSGNAFLQMIRRNGEYYFLEMGYRIDGIGTWVNTKSQNGFSNVELMVDLALGRKISSEKLNPACLRPEMQNNATYLYWAKPGKVVRIVGLDEVKALEGVHIVVERFHVNDIIPKTDSMYQIAYYIGITGKDQKALIETLILINQKLHLYDEEDKDLLTPYKNYNDLLNRCSKQRRNRI